MAKGQLISTSELYDLVLAVMLGGGLYVSYRNGSLAKFWDWFKNIDIGDIINPGGNTGGGSGCTTSFGGGKVTLHGLQSGGQQWRREWELNKKYLNCSFKAYFYIPSGPSTETISIKLRGGPHTGSGDNAQTRQGCCYIMALPFGGGNGKNFQKECPHPVYAQHNIPTKFNPGSILKKWTGFRADLVNVGNGVRITTYIDTSGNPGANQWREWYSITDTGQYGENSAQAPPFTRSPYNGNSPRVIVRIDNPSQSGANGYQMKNASICEIGSSGSSYTDVQAFMTEKVTRMEIKPLIIEESYLARASRLKRSLA